MTYKYTMALIFFLQCVHDFITYGCSLTLTGAPYLGTLRFNAGFIYMYIKIYLRQSMPECQLKNSSQRLRWGGDKKTKSKTTPFTICY